MARENTSRYAVLGMLTLGPRTGYDIKREIGLSIRYFWSESYGQVYPVLRALVRDGLATVSVEHGEGRPDRKVYALTAAGWEELRSWLGRPIQPQPDRNELLLKLFFGRFLPPAELIPVVQEARDRWARNLPEWTALEAWLRTPDADGDPVDRRDRRFTLRYGMAVGEAVVRWADEVIAELQRAAADPVPAEPTRATTGAP